MPHSVEHELLEQQLLSIYHDIVAGPSTSGDFLMKRLASELYARGVRATIGAVSPTKEVTLHHSLDPDQRICWVSKLWNQIMGYRARAAIGLHASSIYSPETYHRHHQELWASVVMTGKAPSTDVTLMTMRGELLSARLTAEALRDSAGLFQRTFARIKVRVPLTLMSLLFAVGGYASSTSVPLEMMSTRPGRVNATSPTTSSPDFTSNDTSRSLPA